MHSLFPFLTFAILQTEELNDPCSTVMGIVHVSETEVLWSACFHHCIVCEKLASFPGRIFSNRADNENPFRSIREKNGLGTRLVRSLFEYGNYDYQKLLCFSLQEGS